MLVIIDHLRGTVEDTAILTDPFDLGFFHVERATLADAGGAQTLHAEYSDFSKGNLTDPDMANPLSGMEGVVGRLIRAALSRYTLSEFLTLPREQRPMPFWLSDPRFWKQVMTLKPSLGPAPALVVDHKDLRLFPFTAFAPSGNLAFDNAMRRQMESYRCTVDGVSILGMNVGSGRALLFPGDLLRGLLCAPPRASHLVEAAFQPSAPDAMTGTLAFQTDACLEWNEGVNFELTKKPLPPSPTEQASPTRWETAFSWLVARFQGVMKRRRGLRESDPF